MQGVAKWLAVLAVLAISISAALPYHVRQAAHSSDDLALKTPPSVPLRIPSDAIDHGRGRPSPVPEPVGHVQIRRDSLQNAIAAGIDEPSMPAPANPGWEPRSYDEALADLPDGPRPIYVARQPGDDVLPPPKPIEVDPDDLSPLDVSPPPAAQAGDVAGRDRDTDQPPGNEAELETASPSPGLGEGYPLPPPAPPASDVLPTPASPELQRQAAPVDDGFRPVPREDEAGEEEVRDDEPPDAADSGVETGATDEAEAPPAAVVRPPRVAAAPATLQRPNTGRPVRRPRWHQVRDGDTLGTLAAQYWGDEQRAGEIYAANRDLLRDPELLPIGVRLRIPDSDFHRGLEATRDAP